MYSRKMTANQLEFWRALLAPFPESALSNVRKAGGKDLTYLDSRALMNRLDSVCGPHGWDITFEATARGYKARMGIMVPSQDDEWSWVYKEDGGGFEEMGKENKTTGEFEYDVDNDEKSAYTNATRRVAQNAWGIGRYLYNKGIPDFLDPNAQPSSIAPASAAPANVAPPTPTSQRQQEAPAPPTAPRIAPGTQQPAVSRSANPFPFAIPRAGKAVFAWAKAMEEHFGTTFIAGLKSDGQRLNHGLYFQEWNQEAVNEVCGLLIEHIKRLENYAGEFGDVGAPQGGVQLPPSKPAATPVFAASASSIADARSEAAATITVFLTEKLGRKPENSELKGAVAEISPFATSGQGHGGEIMESIGKCDDVLWLKNMTARVVKLIAEARAARAIPEVEIPF